MVSFRLDVFDVVAVGEEALIDDFDSDILTGFDAALVNIGV